ncbi:MAG: protein-L-isoaspartate(D-aspartate) O-methyltransferase [bacterium]|nr:protein-L-isoaspartate(D-aspartate) O-methyltransferase [bacterium]
MTGLFQVARRRMVDRIRGRSLAGEMVLAAMEDLPREIFVDPALAPRAYGRDVLPIGFGQTMSHPEVVAFMTQALELTPGMKVLEIGTGSGYQAALLHLLGMEVWTVERIAKLLEGARRAWGLLNILDEINVAVGDGYLGWPETAPFDRILLTAAPPEVPNTLLTQLREGGQLVMPIQEGEQQRLLRLRLEGNRAYREDLGPCSFVPMKARVVEA